MIKHKKKIYEKIDADLIYDICEKIFEEFKHKMRESSKELANNVVKEMEKNNIPTYIRNPDQKSFRCSKAKLLINQRIMSMVKNYLDFSFLCDISRIELKEQMKINRNNDESK